MKQLTSLDSYLSIVHMTPDMCQDLRLKAKLTDSFAIKARLFRSGWGSEFDVLHAERIKCFGDSDFGLGIKEGIGELFALYIPSKWRMLQGTHRKFPEQTSVKKKLTSERALDDFKVGDVTEEIRVSWGIWIPLLVRPIGLAISPTLVGGSGCCLRFYANHLTT